MNYRSELDGLRAIAVGLVMLSHAGVASLKGGFIGVDVFFVLSGYLITTIIYREMESGDFTFRRFYERRIRRIMPALLLVLLCCLPLAFFLLLPSEMVDFSRGSLSVLGFGSNIYYMFRGGYFRHELEENLLLHTWSLAVEEQFYILFPILMIIGYSVIRKRMLVLLASLCILSLVLAEWGWRTFPTANFYSTPMRAWELLTGSLCALYLYRRHHQGVCNESDQIVNEKGFSHSNQQIKSQSHRHTVSSSEKIVGIGTLGLLLVLGSALWFTSRTPTPSLYTLLPVIGSALIILYGENDRSLKAILTLKPMLVLGAISYSAYLWHQPVYAMARILGIFSGWWVIPIVLLTLMLAWCTWKFIENPFRDRKRLSSINAFAILGCVCVVVLVTNVGALLSKGYLSRYDRQDQRLVGMDMIGFGEYVRSRFGNYKGADFDSQKISVMIIGDSYAKDFLNTLHESGYAEKYSVSTHEFRPGCGNLMTDQSFEQHIPDRIKSLCQRNGWYESEELLDRIRTADYIVLASNWTDWESRYIADSLDNITNLASGRVYVLGKKNFGAIDVREYLSVEFDQRSGIIQPIPAEVSLINDSFQRVLDNDQFLDINQIICNATNECRVFTDDNELISLDGTHLTVEGAGFAGQLLFSEETGYFQRYR